MRAWILFVALLAALPACSRLNMENYAKLKVGQSYDEVVAIIGDPTRCDETLGIRQCQWGSEEKGIRVGFAAGKALAFSAQNLK